MSKRLLQNARRSRGVALVIALVLLMVLTMIAVIAMRTTTLDLKMATNLTLSKRAFQSSEGGRARIWGILDSHSYYRGWPTAIGGSVPASSGFSIPAEISIDTPLQDLYLENNADHWDMSSAARDMAMRVDADGDLAYTSTADMAADVFVSRVATIAAPGSDTSQVTGYEGLGAGAAGAGSYLIYRILSRAGGAGATRSTTGSLYRYVITN